MKIRVTPPPAGHHDQLRRWSSLPQVPDYSVAGSFYKGPHDPPECGWDLGLDSNPRTVAKVMDVTSVMRLHKHKIMSLVLLADPHPCWF